MQEAVSFTRLTIARIRHEIKDFVTIVFEDGHGLSYRSGQFITLVDFHHGSEIRRSYSICSSPSANEPLTIAVKRIDNGFFSRKLVDEAKRGDTFLCSGVAGFFCLPDDLLSFKKIYFFAAGSGITPILSLMKSALYDNTNAEVYLIYSNTSLENTAFYSLLKKWSYLFPDRLHIDFLMSSSADLRRARLNRDLLLEFLSISRSSRNNTLFYTCGPENYMRMISFLLLEEGFPRENIKKEDFNPGKRTAVHKLPPDKNTYDAEIRVGKETYLVPVHYPDSILKAARRQKLNLPYSCETGKCGSCAALCLSGEVWLAANEVLTEKELGQGMTLTCTGHPQHGPVILKIT